MAPYPSVNAVRQWSLPPMRMGRVPSRCAPRPLSKCPPGSRRSCRPCRRGRGGQRLMDLERAWFAARAAVAGRRRDSQAAASRSRTRSACWTAWLPSISPSRSRAGRSGGCSGSGAWHHWPRRFRRPIGRGPGPPPPLTVENEVVGPRPPLSPIERRAFAYSGLGRSHGLRRGGQSQHPAAAGPGGAWTEPPARQGRRESANVPMSPGVASFATCVADDSETARGGQICAEQTNVPGCRGRDHSPRDRTRRMPSSAGVTGAQCVGPA